MATRTAAVKAAPDPDDPVVSTSESLAQDVEAEALTFEPGTPVFLAHLQMPRIRRAKAYGALGAIMSQHRRSRGDEKVDAPDEPSDEVAAEPIEVDPAEYGERYLIVGLIEEYLAVCAVDEDAFRRWALTVDDNVLIKTFNVYVKVNQPGEANSSAS